MPDQIPTNIMNEDVASCVKMTLAIAHDWAEEQGSDNPYDLNKQALVRLEKNMVKLDKLIVHYWEQGERDRPGVEPKVTAVPPESEWPGSVPNALYDNLLQELKLLAEQMIRSSSAGQSGGVTNWDIARWRTGHTQGVEDTGTLQGILNLIAHYLTLHAEGGFDLPNTTPYSRRVNLPSDTSSVPAGTGDRPGVPPLQTSGS